MKQPKVKDHSQSLEIDEEEKQRLKILTRYEEEARLQGFNCIAGLDEAGRGPLAGPVVAAACIIPEGIYIPYVNDSKKLSSKMRQQLFAHLIKNPLILYAIGIVDSQEIDRINIYQATIQAMLKAISKLEVMPDHLLVDGMYLSHPMIPCTKIIRGDTLSQSIAAASIIAKETRDNLMRQYHLQWPQYGFDQHKGYGTAQHLKAIQQYGPCEIHRLSFAPFRENVECTISIN